MSRLERAICTIVYFVAGLTIVVACIWLGEALKAHEVGIISGYIVFTLWISAWKQFREQIIVDMCLRARRLSFRGAHREAWVRAIVPAHTKPRATMPIRAA